MTMPEILNKVVSLFPEYDEPALPKPSTSTKRFEEFWAAYPKRVGKPLAKAKYDAIVKGGFKTRTFDKDSNSYVEIEIGATEEEIIEGAKHYMRSLIDHNFKRTVEDKFLPYPATWLNQGRWMDQ